MSFDNLISGAKTYFPELQVKYKDSSLLMKIIGTIMFFSPSFMSNYITTIGNTIYIPNQNYITSRPVSAAVVFMHEVVHLYDHRRLGTFWFQLSYVMPQIFALPALLLFLLSWKIALPVVLFFLLPLPSYFRMKYERRAYYASIYIIQKLSEKLNFDPHLESQNTYFVECFADSTYYFMWPFSSIIADDFTTARQLVQAGKRPYEDPVFDILDDLVTKV